MKVYQLTSTSASSKAISADHWTNHPATNRQKKVLALFGVAFNSEISKGSASRHITRIFAREEAVARWAKYLLLTGETDDASPALKAFSEEELQKVILPTVVSLSWEERMMKLNGWDRKMFEDNQEAERQSIEEQMRITCPAKPEQQKLLEEFGFVGIALSSSEADLLLLRVQRPINYALSSTFKNFSELQACYQHALRVAMASWDKLENLPRYGPYSKWDDLEQCGNNPHRRLTVEERVAVTDLASNVLPAAAFLALVSNGVKKHKERIDAQLIGI